MSVTIQRESHPTAFGRNGHSAASKPKCQQLIDALNHDLAGELKAIGMYTYYAAMLTGRYRRELRVLFLGAIADEQAHAQFLSDKIAALGGEPTTDARPVAHADQAREMLEHALMAEQQAVTGYATRIGEADQFGDYGLKAVLENIIADETRHKEEIERILAGWQDAIRESDASEDRWQDDGGPSTK